MPSLLLTRLKVVFAVNMFACISTSHYYQYKFHTEFHIVLLCSSIFIKSFVASNKSGSIIKIIFPYSIYHKYIDKSTHYIMLDNFISLANSLIALKGLKVALSTHFRIAN